MLILPRILESLLSSHKWNSELSSGSPQAIDTHPPNIFAIGIKYTRINKKSCQTGVLTLFRNFGDILANKISFEYPEIVSYKQDRNVNPIIYKISAIK